MAFPFLLLATQAAGFSTNLYFNRQKSRMEAAGYALDEAQVNMRMQQEALASTQEQLGDIKRLQETMATQRAIFAARGVNAGQGTARTIQEGSHREYAEELRTKNINKGFREGYMESMKRLMKIEQAGKEATRGSETFMTGLNMFSFNEIFGKNKLPKTEVKKGLNG